MSYLSAIHLISGQADYLISDTKQSDRVIRLFYKISIPLTFSDATLKCQTNILYLTLMEVICLDPVLIYSHHLHKIELNLT